MAQITPYIDIKDFQDKFNNLINTIDKSGVVFEKTLKDMGSRAPGKVADAVRTVYNIKKSEITCKKGFSKTSAGVIKASGKDLMSFTLTYEGRMLTPLHFGMTPKQRPEKKKYKVKAKIKKGVSTVLKPEKNEQVVAGGAVFLGRNPKKPSQIIPWERISSDSHDIRGKRVMSLPQMVGPNPNTGEGGNPIVMQQIGESLTELLDKRFHHHLQRHLEKSK